MLPFSFNRCSSQCWREVWSEDIVMWENVLLKEVIMSWLIWIKVLFLNEAFDSFFGLE